MHTGRFGNIFFVVAAMSSLTAQAAPRGDSIPEISPQWQQDVDIPCGQSRYGGGPYALDVRPGVGALVRTDKRIAAYSPEGELAWQASMPCDRPPFLNWEQAILTPDGGAWVLLAGYGYGVLQRFDDKGQVSASVDLGLDYSDRVILALSGDDESAITVHATGNTIEWRRVELASGAVELREHVLDSDLYRIAYEPRPLADGGLGMAFGTFYCDLAACPPPILEYLLAPLTSEGDLRWQVEGRAGIPLFDPQGSADIIGVDTYNLDGPQFLRHVTAEGEVEPDTQLTGITGRLIDAYGPYAGRDVILTADQNGDEHLWSIDRAGNLLETRALQHRITALDRSLHGLLVWEPDGDAARLLRIDPLSLQATTCFRLDEVAEPYDLANSSRLLDDGTLYASFAAPANGEFGSDDHPRIILARFAVPAAGGAERRQRAITARAQLREQR